MAYQAFPLANTYKYETDPGQCFDIGTAKLKQTTQNDGALAVQKPLIIR